MFCLFYPQATCLVTVFRLWEGGGGRGGGGGGMLLLYSLIFVSNFKKRLTKGPVPESNPGPLAPKARIIPLDQQAHMTMKVHCRLLYVTFVKYWYR